MYSSRVLHTLLLFFMVLNARAQESLPPATSKPKERFVDRLFVGGNLGAQFGTVTIVDVSPLAGYRITEKFGAGIGATYIYFRDRSNSRYEYETNIYGGRLFGQYQVLENIMAYSELEVLSAEVYDLNGKLHRRNITSFLVGGGYTQRIGPGSSFMIMGLWNLLEDEYSLYQNPIIRMGIKIGL